MSVFFFNLTTVGGALIFSKCEGSVGCDERHIHVQLQTQDRSLVIREGDSNFAASFEGTKASSTDASDILSVPESELPIENWGKLQAVDLLILCTASDFKFYLNGKHVKSLSSQFWHNSMDGSYPNIEAVKWRFDDNVEGTKLAWTYGK